MATTVHAYTITVSGNSLKVRSGELSLDARRAPHVQGQLEIAFPGSWATVLGRVEWVPAPEIYNLLDPRSSPAPRVTVTASAGIPRTFDLHVRDRSIGQRAGVVTLVLASDEKLLDDYAPLADDKAPRAFESSLRGVVNYVLGKAIPGAALEAGSADADLTATWKVTNQLTNPSVEVDLTGWAAVVGCSIVRTTSFAYSGGASVLATLTSGAGNPMNVRLNPAGQGPAVTPGLSYVAAVRLSSNPGVIASAYARINWLNRAGAVIGQADGAPVASNTAWNALTVIAKAPVGAVSADVYAVAPIAGSVGQQFLLDAAMFYEGNEVVPYFDGSTPATARYTYSWSQAPHASQAVRTPVVERLPELFTWRAGRSALEFLHSLVQSRGFRLVCDESRKWTLRDENYQADGSLSLRSGVNVVEASETISRDGGYWFDARATRYRWTDEYGIQQERVDTYALTPSYTRMTDMEVDAVYPGPGRSEYAVRRAQGVGREVTVETVSDWTVQAEMPVSVLLDYAPTGVGRVQSVTYNLSNDRMTVTTRTVDLQAGAVDLLTGTVDGLTGTINAL